GPRAGRGGGGRALAGPRRGGRGAARAPTPLRRLDLPQGQARGRRVVRGLRPPRGRGGDRPARRAGSGAASLHLRRRSRTAQARPLLGDAGRRRHLPPERRGRRGSVARPRRRRRAAHLPSRSRRARGRRGAGPGRRGAVGGGVMARLSTYRRTPNDPTDWFSADELERARRYQRPLTVVRLVRGALSLGVVVAFVVAQVGPRL